MLDGNAEKRGWLGKAAQGPELGHASENSDFLPQGFSLHHEVLALVLG